MKPSILIFSQFMVHGGAERSLLGLLDSIDYDRCDIPEIPQYASSAAPPSCGISGR